LIFLSETFFPYFFHVHLSILDKVVSSLYAILGHPVYNSTGNFFILSKKILDLTKLILTVSDFQKVSVINFLCSKTQKNPQKF
jgi:hypothetical protein